MHEQLATNKDACNETIIILVNKIARYNKHSQCKVSSITIARLKSRVATSTLIKLINDAEYFKQI